MTSWTNAGVIVLLALTGCAEPAYTVSMDGDVVTTSLREGIVAAPRPDSGVRRDWSVDIGEIMAHAVMLCSAEPNPVTSTIRHCRDGRLDGANVFWLRQPNGDAATTVRATFADNVANGPAQIVLADGRQFEGELRDNKPNGVGLLILPDGQRVRGVFRDGILSGWVTIFFVDGVRLRTTYRNGNLDGPALAVFPDGTRFHYTLRDGHYAGRARLTYADGGNLSYRFVGGAAGGTAVYRTAAGRKIVGRFTPPQPDPTAWHLPEFPQLSRRLNEAGVTTLSFAIGIDGKVSELRLHETSGAERLDDAAFLAATAWRYRPARVGAHPVPMRVILALPFELH